MELFADSEEEALRSCANPAVVQIRSAMNVINLTRVDAAPAI
jgi:hypothetical protein